MQRSLSSRVKADLAAKMVFVTGPRQVGKTYFAKDVLREFARPLYLNYDVPGDARIIREQSWPLAADALAFDELHKMPGWKTYLKGVFDGRPEGQSILVTGSARPFSEDTFRQSGESLAGRYFHFHLFPLSVRELREDMAPNAALEQLNRLGGFPEPFLSGSEETAARWRNQYYTDLIREDILEFSRITEIRAMRTLLELLRDRVGSPLSYTSLARDLHISHPTVKRYIEILESLYIIFLIRPFHKNVARALLKEPKLYFFDTGLVRGDDGVRLENACAVSLLKHAAYLRDATGQDVFVRYVRDKEGRELDFVLEDDGQVREMIEVKLSDADPAPNLMYFQARAFPEARATQLVQHLAKERRAGEITVRPAADYLAELSA